MIAMLLTTLFIGTALLSAAVILVSWHGAFARFVAIRRQLASLERPRRVTAHVAVPQPGGFRGRPGTARIAPRGGRLAAAA